MATQELVVISGKGGTGKTSITAALATLAGTAVIADCDVDAADLHLVLGPEIKTKEAFIGGLRAEVAAGKCSGCGKCKTLCRFEAVTMTESNQSRIARIDPVACEGCGVCAWFCPEKAINFEPEENGEWFISDTRFGEMVHARLGVAQENSGKLVSLIKKQARELAGKNNRSLIIIDGSPGIGCPVIASVTGADKVLIVAEPTSSSVHDLKRVVKLANYFRGAVYICVNKWDINPDIAKEIRRYCLEQKLNWAGFVRYDEKVVEAQIKKQTVVELGPSDIARDIEALWNKINEKEASHDAK